MSPINCSLILSESVVVIIIIIIFIIIIYCIGKHAPAAFTAQEIFLYSFPLEAGSIPGPYCRQKHYVRRTKISYKTFQIFMMKFLVIVGSNLPS
jgi:hypothetical protein